MRVLLACEESQTVCKAFRALGHEAFSADLYECSGGHPEWHIQGDVLPYINGDCEFTTMDGQTHTQVGEWDMLIAFPPCTYLSNVGAPHLFPKGVLNKERFEKGLEAKTFFLAFLNAKCQRVVIENPTPSKIYELPPYSQVVQPWQYGHEFQKRTCLWLKNLPQLIPTKIMEKREPTTSAKWYNGGGVDRQKNRSKFWQGIADAMASQWGALEAPFLLPT